MKQLSILLTFALLGSLTSACELLASLTKTTQAVSLVTRTPDLADAIPDANLRTALSTGAVLEQIDDGATGVFVGIGQRPEAWSVEAPTPVSGADVVVSWGSNEVAVCEVTGGSEGTYAASSIAEDPCGDATFTYEETVTYTTQISFEDVVGSVSVEAPPAIDPLDVTFNPALTGPADHSGATLYGHGGGSLVVDWSDAPGASDRPAILTVFRIEYTGGPTGALQAANWHVGNNPVHTDAPDTAEELINVILLGNNVTTAEIPSSVFTVPGLYFVVLTSLNLNTTVDNLGVGSGALAGVGTVWAFWVD